MLTEIEASRYSRGAGRNIVPFVCDVREPEAGLVRFSRRDDIHACVEAGVELVLVVAGVAGVLAGVLAR
jgi:hypothetical protein